MLSGFNPCCVGIPLLRLWVRNLCRWILYCFNPCCVGIPLLSLYFVLVPSGISAFQSLLCWNTSIEKANPGAKNGPKKARFNPCCVGIPLLREGAKTKETHHVKRFQSLLCWNTSIEDPRIQKGKLVYMFQSLLCWNTSIENTLVQHLNMRKRVFQSLLCWNTSIEPIL